MKPRPFSKFFGFSIEIFGGKNENELKLLNSSSGCLLVLGLSFERTGVSRLVSVLIMYPTGIVRFSFYGLFIQLCFLVENDNP